MNEIRVLYSEKNDVDEATIHRTESYHNKKHSKQEFQELCQKHGISFTDRDTKPTLAAMIVERDENVREVADHTQPNRTSTVTDIDRQVAFSSN